MRFWSALVARFAPLVPYRRDVCDRITALPELPEARRMQTRQLVMKPKDYAAWKRQNRRAS